MVLSKRSITPKKSAAKNADFFERVREESWTYIKTVVDVVREPVLILDKNLCVISANEPFYRTFQVEAKETENKVVYKLGNGQWDIPSLRNLLEDILPKNTFFKGFEVEHDFPSIGHKIMILNAREIHFSEDVASKQLPKHIIMLAIEDVTEIMGVAKRLSSHTNMLEEKFAKSFNAMQLHIKKLEKDIAQMKKKFA